MLKLCKVTVAAEHSKPIVRNVSLTIGKGELHVLLGPNAAGKSTLLHAIAGTPFYRVISGNIFFEGEDITRISPFERAVKGIFLAHQNPPEIRGVTLRVFLQHLVKKYNFGGNVRRLLSDYGFIEEHLSREVNVGFSGGERKRLELLQAEIINPKLLLLDEPDSGIDVDSLKLIAEKINNFIQRGKSILLVTHRRHILEYLEDIHVAYVMISGRIVYSGEPHTVFKVVEEKGFKYFKHVPEGVPA